MPPERVELGGVGAGDLQLRPILGPPEMCHPVCLEEVCLAVLIWEQLPVFALKRKSSKTVLDRHNLLLVCASSGGSGSGQISPGFHMPASGWYLWNRAGGTLQARTMMLSIFFRKVDPSPISTA